MPNGVWASFLVEIIYDRETGKSRGFGFVTFQTPEEATETINSLHETVSWEILK